jgi:hypothetical protein
MRLKIALAALALGVTAAASLFGLLQLRAYVTEDPRFCASCHRASPEFAVLGRDEHARVTCQKCHHTTTEQSLGMLSVYLAGGQPGGGAGGDGKKHAPVELGACASCHLTHDKEWATQVGASRGHRVHAIEQKIACTRCHGAGIHRFEPVARSCVGCHGDHSVGLAGMQQVHCFACHDFLSVENGARPSRRDCLHCHQTQGLHPSRFPDEAPMRFACAACHKPHAKAPGAELVACDKCHTEMKSAGLHGASVLHRRDCRECHRPHGWRSGQADCLRCHAEAATHHPDHPSCRECHSWKGAAALPTPPRDR